MTHLETIKKYVPKKNQQYIIDLMQDLKKRTYYKGVQDGIDRYKFRIISTMYAEAVETCKELTRE